MSKRKPSIKQQKALDNMIQNGGNVSKAMREAGYADSTASNPHKLKDSVGFMELMEEHLPDDLLAKVHEEGLAATKGEDPDYQTRHKYLDTAYKIRGKMVEKREVKTSIEISREQEENADKALTDYLGK